MLLVGLVLVTLVINGTRDFFGLWWKTMLFVWLWNLYDCFVIDEWWVGHTNAWQIPGAEGWDYIPKGSKSKKRLAIGLLAPVLAAALAAVLAAVSKLMV